MFKFKIDGLNCMSCFHNIEDALKEFDASIAANADVRNQTLMVESTQSVELLTRLIKAAGYQVKEVIKG